MKVQFGTKLTDRTGKEIIDGPNQRPLTLGAICVGVLDVTFPDEANEGLKAKLRRAELMEKIEAGERDLVPVDMLDSDREDLKNRLARRNDLPVSLFASIIKMLDTDASAAQPDAEEKAAA